MWWRQALSQEVLLHQYSTENFGPTAPFQKLTTWLQHQSVCKAALLLPVEKGRRVKNTKAVSSPEHQPTSVGDLEKKTSTSYFSVIHLHI